MRKKKFVLTTISSLGYQVTALVCGFILPRVILLYFGSAINGLVNSVAQFLSIITFLECGVGVVIQSALYKPLADSDNIAISKILASGEKFFRKIAMILLIYVVILMCVYPFFNQEFSWIFTATLIAAISISSFAQYYFGVVDRILLYADQKGYIQYSAQIVTLVVNTIACVILIKMGCGIHFVKLTTSLIYLVRPFFLRWYVSRNYRINRKIKLKEEPLKQKWNGMAQHVAAIILTSTDIIILTLFSNLANVSIYSVYNLVVNGIRQVFTALNSGFHSLIGELWAKQQMEELNEVFGMMEWFIHTATTFIFGCTFCLLIPFVEVYTMGVKDANYYQPLFAAIITIAWAFNCLSVPYQAMIIAAGHYKQTQVYFVISATMNLSISVLFVYKFGLVGVAIGTLVAMVFQTMWMVIYCTRNLNHWPITCFIKQMFVDVVTFICGICVFRLINTSCQSYIAWIILAIKCVVIWFIISVVINELTYKQFLHRTIKKVIK